MHAARGARRPGGARYAPPRPARDDDEKRAPLPFLSPAPPVPTLFTPRRAPARRRSAVAVIEKPTMEPSAARGITSSVAGECIVKIEERDGGRRARARRGLAWWGQSTRGGRPRGGVEELGRGDLPVRRGPVSPEWPPRHRMAARRGLQCGRGRQGGTSADGRASSVLSRAVRRPSQALSQPPPSPLSTSLIPHTPAVILGGGAGTRLYPLTKQVRKKRKQRESVSAAPALSPPSPPQPTSLPLHFLSLSPFHSVPSPPSPSAAHTASSTCPCPTASTPASTRCTC